MSDTETSTVAEPLPPQYYCPACGARYFGPTVCTNMHPPTEAVLDPTVAPAPEEAQAVSEPQAPASSDSPTTEPTAETEPAPATPESEAEPETPAADPAPEEPEPNAAPAEPSATDQAKQTIAGLISQAADALHSAADALAHL